MKDLLKLVEKVPHVVKRDVLDNLLLDRHSEKMVNKAKELDPSQEFFQFPYLLKDAYLTFYKPILPEFLPDDQILPEFLVNKAVLEKLQNTEAFDDMKRSTTLDDVNSAIATLLFAEKLYALLKEKLNEIKELTKEINDLRREIFENRRPTKEQLQKMDRLGEKIKGTITQMLVSEVAKEVKRNYDDVRNSISIIRGWGNEAGSIVRENPEEVIKLAELLLKNKRLLEVVKYLGMAKNCLKSVIKEKFKKEPAE